jgi:lipopolysaccharide export system permease protein
MPTNSSSRPNQRTWGLLPKQIDFYLISEVMGPFLGGILFFSFIFLMFQALRLADFFIIHGVAGSVLLKMIGLMVLSFLPVSLPIAFLIGVLVGFGRLSADSELVAMKAHGFSIYRLMYPVLLLSSAVVGVSLYLNMDWVPWGDRTFKSTLIRVSNTKVVSTLKEGTFTTGFFDLLVYADKVDQKTNQLERVFLYDEREPKSPMTIVAQKGEIVSVRTNSSLASSAALRLRNGSIHSNDLANAVYNKIDFEEYQLFLKVEEGDDTSTVKPRMLGYEDLQKKLREIPPSTQEFREIQGEFWRRYAVAWSPLIFVLLGVGFGSYRTRAVRSGAALIALVIVVIYWGVQAFGTVALQKGWIAPPLAMWLPNIAIGILAYFGFRSATW